ncbi:efflux RND transporter periplasmic adaptor subunit [Undibacterium luofuense]|uniref:Efflux RND transporter periplasmic adaptor subunit n=1 Tax=Undibacterium luofuense TaxID=2828733 RepID=A0A941I8F4_9BURK|nr:efflux RND transporter periplasmic adaptor subunit [Undibacterium luofuense]MBR7783819.1 efflux RND transporter periplasmic adaptor subunit [Undibacterium luofuense]
MNKKKLITLIAITCISIPVAIVYYKRTQPEVMAEVEKVGTGAIQSAFFTSGMMTYKTQAKLSPEIIAKVSQIYVNEGQPVKTGQLLIKLDDSAAKAELNQAQVQVAQATIEWQRIKTEAAMRQREAERQKLLMDAGLVRAEAYEPYRQAAQAASLQADYAEKSILQAKSVVALRQKTLERTEIRSPIDGLVISSQIKVGETAVASSISMAGSSLMTVADPNSIIVETQIAEFDIGRIRLNQTANITTRAIPNEVFTGKVYNIARTTSGEGKTGADAKSLKTVAVQIMLDRTHPDFISGMSCDVALTEAAQRNAVLIPLTALRVESDNSVVKFDQQKRRYYVWQVKNAQAVKVLLELGYADEFKQEVRKGLKAGDEIITGPAAYLETLKDGASVTKVRKQ